MFKKLIIASIVLASSSVFALNGTPYIGAGFGVDHQLFKAKEDGGTLNFGGTTALFNVNAGYGALVTPKVYLGGELLANFTTSDVKAAKVEFDNDEIGSLKFKTKYTYGASLIPGVMIADNTMAYGRIGIVRSRFDVKQTSAFEPSTKDENSVTGGQFGLGVQTKLTNNVDVRGEYVYSAYNSFTSMGSDIDPSSGQATVGFVYKIQ